MGYDFAYGNTRIRGMKTRLLSKEDLSSAARCKDLKAFVALLEHTPYKEVMSELKGHSKREVEKALFKQLVNDLERLEDMAPDGEHDIFEALRHKYEVDNIKALLAAKINNVDKEMIREGLPFPFGKRSLTAQLIENDLDKCIDLLQKNGYEMGEAYKIYKEKNVPHVLFVTLDRNYYSMLWATLNRYPAVKPYGGEAKDPSKKLARWIGGEKIPLANGLLGILPDNRSVVRDFVGVEMDFVNFVNILRAKKQGYDAKVVLLPSYWLDTKGALSMDDDKLFIVMGKRLYSGSVEKKDNIAEVEKQVKKYVYKNYMTAIGQDVLGVGPFIAFLKIKEQEVWNLVAICNSIGILEEKEIEELIL